VMPTKVPAFCWIDCSAGPVPEANAQGRASDATGARHHYAHRAKRRFVKSGCNSLQGNFPSLPPPLFRQSV
jgi:hypothetical protein